MGSSRGARFCWLEKAVSSGRIISGWESVSLQKPAFTSNILTEEYHKRELLQIGF